MAKQKVLIVGGGFGGVKAALILSEDERFDITLLTDDPDLRYYPALYHTATGGRSANSSIPLNKIFDHMGVKIVIDSALNLDRKAKQIVTAQGAHLDYDSLIVAIGVVTNYMGIKGLKENSFSIKSQDEVAKFKKHLHQQITEDHKPDLNYIIVGAGPTGIELAGALPSYLDSVLTYHGADKRKIHIDLIEAAPKLLPRMPKATSRAVRRRLKRLGINIYINSMVEGADSDSLMVSGKPIMTHTIIWTAGVMNHPFFSNNAFSLTNHGKVSVDAYLRAEENIYVIGDNANTPYSGMAQTAILDGAFVANNLIRQQDAKEPKSYVVKKPITVIPAGPHWSAVVWGKLKIYGWLGWIIRELADLVGFKDLENWNQALKQWSSEFGSQEECPICTKAMSK
jgi:NADH dehydrogenase